MAGLEQRNGNFNIIIRYGGQRFVRSLKTKSKTEANELKQRVERRQRLAETGDLLIPEGADVPTFLLTDGKLTTKPAASATLTLTNLFSDFFDSIPEGNLEVTTLNGMKTHRKHLERLIGARFPVQQLTTEDLQIYVTKRSKEKGIRGGTVGKNTINKELVTFRTAWGWGVDHGKIQGTFPRRGVRLPKGKEMPPFQTWEEIERKIPNASSSEQADLWDCLYLTMSEIEKLLADVKRYASFPFIHPMFCFAAYTGARRAEIIRSQVEDIDFKHKIITIREKKRVRGKLTTRRVPLSEPLAKVLKAWLKTNSGPHTFCHTDKVIERSRKSKSREEGLISLTRDEAAHHFKQTLVDSKWEVIRGWHCFRHSFISNCASRGIDQRILDEWVGHTTESMRRRYRHLLPSVQQDAMKILFK